MTADPALAALVERLEPDEVEQVARAIYDHDMGDGDALAVTLHCSEYVDAKGIAAQLEQVMDICRGIARTALAASLRARAAAP